MGKDETVPIAVTIPKGKHALSGILTIPDGARSLALLVDAEGGAAEGRNLRLAGALRRSGIGTCVLGLLTPDEDRIYARRYDVSLLTERALETLERLRGLPGADLPLGCVGGPSGSAAVLCAAALRPDHVRTVVCVGGRPDLAREALPRVRAPTLLVVGAEDRIVLDLNRTALTRLGSNRKDLALVPGASHGLTEAGALDEVGRVAAEWLTRYSR